MRARALCEASFKRPTYGITLYQSLTLTFLYQRCCANVCTVPQGYRQGESRGGGHRTKVTMLVGSRRRALVRPRRATSPGRQPNHATCVNYVELGGGRVAGARVGVWVSVSGG